MATTQEIVKQLLELEESLDTDEGSQYVRETKNTLQLEIQQKIESIDEFLIEVRKREFVMDASIEALKEEEDRLKTRRRALSRTKDWFNHKLLPFVIEKLGDEDGIWETDIARYKLYETYGEVKVDPSLVKYKKVEVRESIDKSKARKDAMNAHKDGKLIKGLSIERLKRVRRS